MEILIPVPRMSIFQVEANNITELSFLFDSCIIACCVHNPAKVNEGRYIPGVENLRLELSELEHRGPNCAVVKNA